MTKIPSLAKVWFVISVAALGVGYGIAAERWGYFPSAFAEQAYKQLRSVVSTGPTTFMGWKKYDRHGVRNVDPESIQPGLTLISSSWKDVDGWEPELRLINKRGKVLHKWRIEREKIFRNSGIQRNSPTKTGVHGSYLLPGGDILVSLAYVGMARLDACGEVRWTLSEGNHHSISRAPDGSFWVPGVSQELRGKSERYPGGFPGLRSKKVWIDQALRVSEDGKVIEKINILEILYKNGMERHIPKMLGGPWFNPSNVNEDITHINDIEPAGEYAKDVGFLKSEDIMISSRSLNLVFIMSPKNGKIKWIKSSPFIYQHDPDFVGKGWIGVFDNNVNINREGEKIDKSRVLAFDLNSDSMRVLYPSKKSGPFYTGTQGKWQMLKNGNMLLTETRAGRVAEVDPSGRTVWEWIHEPTEDSEMPAVTKATRVDLTVDEIASWPCFSIDSIDQSSE
jgi:hypothetical protein